MKSVLVIAIIFICSLAAGCFYLLNAPAQYTFDSSRDPGKSERFNEPAPEGISEEMKERWSEWMQNPYRERRLLKVESIEPIDENTSGFFKSESVTVIYYKLRLRCRDLNNNEKVMIRVRDLSLPVIQEIKEGDVIAAFCSDPKWKTFVRFDKFSGDKDPTAFQQWFQNLK